MGYPLFRRIFASIPALALVAAPAPAGASHTAVGPGAGTQSVAAPALDELPDPAALATDGAAIEAVLGEIGLGAAWRATVGLDPRARAMTVDYGGDDTAITQLLTTVITWGVTNDAHADAVHRLRETALALNRARDAERDRAIDRNRADAHFRGTHALMQSVALDLFAGGDPQSDALLGLDGAALTDAQRTQELTSHTLEEMMERRRQAQADLDAAIAAHERAVQRRSALEADHDELTAEVNRLRRTKRDLETASRRLLPAAAEEYVVASIPRESGLTPRALGAYIAAERSIAELNPNCRISWRTIAAVGAVEGRHGSYGGRRLGADGRPDDPIVGIVLDGVATDNFGEVVAAIPDTDGGRWDGDPVFDRAVGPMQFIPETWARWGLDGDGDGDADPHDIDDATLSAAAYLCNYGSLRTWDVWNTAVFGYNHSVAYVTSVKANLDRLLGFRLPAVEGAERLEVPAPYGEWVPPPEPPPEPGEEGDDGTVEPAVTAEGG